MIASEELKNSKGISFTPSSSGGGGGGSMRERLQFASSPTSDSSFVAQEQLENAPLLAQQSQLQPQSYRTIANGNGSSSSKKKQPLDEVTLLREENEMLKEQVRLLKETIQEMAVAKSNTTCAECLSTKSRNFRISASAEDEEEFSKTLQKSYTSQIFLSKEENVRLSFTVVFLVIICTITKRRLVTCERERKYYMEQLADFQHKALLKSEVIYGQLREWGKDWIASNHVTMKHVDALRHALATASWASVAQNNDITENFSIE